MKTSAEFEDELWQKTESVAVWMIDARDLEMFRAGEASMRERASRESELGYCENVAQRIRALPLSDEVPR